MLEAQGHEAVAVDLPGNTYGEFDIPAARGDPEVLHTHVCQVLDQLDEPVVLVGHSLGASPSPRPPNTAQTRSAPWFT